MKAFHLKISGIVQGVWFRASAKERAEYYGVSGWVKNTVDGSVEAYAQGTDEAVEMFLQWCREGPPGARVDQVEAVKAELEPEIQGFLIRR